MKYRNAYFFRSPVACCVILLVIIVNGVGCKRETVEPSQPEILLSKDSLNIFSDTIVPMGTAMRFSIKASGGSSPLTNFVIKYRNLTETFFLDTGIYTEDFSYVTTVLKGNAQEEEWAFFVMNKDRQTAEYRIKVGLDTGAVFGNVIDYHFTLGAQDNAVFGPFYSFQTDSAYTLQQAATQAQAIDINYYYHTTYESVLSSPNDNDAPLVFTGTYGISNWPVRNEARYNLTALSTADFDNVQNDSILIASYDITGAKRKAKNVVAGQVWAFRIQSGRMGLIRVDNVSVGVTGAIELSIKLQE